MALKDDNINLRINIGTTAAQKQIQELADKNRELEKSSAAIRVEMAKLAAQGKQNTNEYKLLSDQLKANNLQMAENKKQISEVSKSMDVNSKTMTQLRKDAKELQAQLDRTVQSADPKGYAALQKELDAVKKRMAELRTAGGSLSSQLQSIPGPAGGVAKSVSGINSAFKMLLANPIMAILAAIVLVFMALYKALTSSEEGVNKLNKMLAPLRAIMDAVLNVVQKCVGAIVDFISAIINGLMKALEKLPFVGKYFKELNEYAAEAIALEEAKQALAKRERASTEENAKIARDVAELRNKAKQKELYSEKERIAFLEEAIALEKRRAEETKAIAEERLRIAEAEAARAGNSAEVEEELAKLRADVYAAETEYFSKTREMESELTKFRADEARARQEAAKKALDDRLKRVDKEIQAERSKWIQARLNREIDDEELNKKLQELEMEALNKRLAVHGIEKEERDKINQQILDAKLKIMQTEEKAAQTLAESVRQAMMSIADKEYEDFEKKYLDRIKILKEGLEAELITREEYAKRIQEMRAERQAEIDAKEEEERKKKVAQEMAEKDAQFENEKVELLEKRANDLISQEEYNTSLIELEQKFLDEKLRINGLTEEQITKFNEQQLLKRIAAQDAALKNQQAQLGKYKKVLESSASQFGEIFGKMALGAEETNEELQYNLVMLTLDTLRNMIIIYATQALTKAIGDYGMPYGAVIGAAAAGLITGAFEAMKSKIKKPSSKNSGSGDTRTGSIVVNQHAAGRYDVVGAEDGRAYNNVPFIGDAPTGVVRGPALVSERGDELIVSSPHLKLLRRHVNYPHILSAINDVRSGRVPQHADGSYDTAAADTPIQEENYPNWDRFSGSLDRLSAILDVIEANGLRAVVGLDEFDATRKLRDESRALGTLS
jgi:DNA repair exonuclease SbcCD ATPase subunit